MWRTWLFEFTDENSNMCGEQFCVELDISITPETPQA